MAISAPSSLGSANATTLVSSWPAALVNGIPAGTRALVWVITNNVATSDGASNTHLSLTSATLTWEKLSEITASSGAAEDGVTISAWLSSVAGATTTPAFTVEFSGSLTTRLARGLALAGSNLGVDATAARTNYANTAYGSVTISGLPSKERAWVRMSGGEYGASTAATPTSGWTLDTGTNTGSTTSGLLSRSEYKISASTEETSSFTQNVALDSASILVAISEDGGGGGGTPVAFSGSVSNQTGTEGVAFSLNLSSYFSGSETPFAYSVQSGTLPAGLSLNTSTGVISGTPTTAGVSSGIVIRATDATPDTADTNSFSITINAAGDAENPTLTGSVTFASITQTSYTAQWPAGSDNVAVTGYEYQIGSTAGAWTDAGNNLSAAITGRTAGATETVYVRAYDAAGLRSTPAISGSVTLESALAAGINVTEPLKNNAGTVLASQSGVRVAVLQAADLVSVHEATGLTTNASGILATISDAAITTGQQYHVAIKLADGSVGITGPITAS